MKKSTIIFLCALILVAILFLIYRLFFYYSIDLQLSEDNIKVNMYDEIDLKSFIYKAADNKKNNLKDIVELSVECDDEDVFDEKTLYIKGFGPKVITYTIEKRNKTVIKKLIIKVITNPNDSDFKPNDDKIDSESEIDSDEIPNSGGDTNFSEEQLKYLDSL